MLNQLRLFDQPAESSVSRDHLGLEGLHYYVNVFSDSEQAALLQAVDAAPWLSDLSRRVQHYGYKYDYKARRIDPSMFVGSLPGFAVEAASRLVERNIIRTMPDQMIVNEYVPGQGITAHVDCEPCFTDTIVTVSLGSVVEMEFASLATKEMKTMLLELGSALVLTGSARYQWTHAIRARKSDHGKPRGRRVSLTFRNVILGE